MAYATDDLNDAEQLIQKVIFDRYIVRAMELCRWLLSFNSQETHSIKCYQSFGERPDIRFCIDRGGDCDGLKIMTGFLVIEPNFEIMGLYSANSYKIPYFKHDTDRRWRISAADTAALPIATIRDHILDSYLEKVKQLHLVSDASMINISPCCQFQKEGVIVSDVFMNKSSWLAFAKEHNASASFNATQLNGSQSYTLAAVHLSTGIPLSKTVLLDTKRAQGIFISNHFSGLRKLYESNIESSPWLPDILEKSRKFARVHSVDSDEMIKKMIEMTEKKGRKSSVTRNIPMKAAIIEIDDEDDIKI